MKKVFVAAIAVVAISFASCGSKTEQAADAADSTEVVANDASAAADEIISALSEQIEKKDASALQATLESIKAKIAEYISTNPEVAKEYLGKVQGFLKDNAESIKAAVGNNAAVSSLIDGIAAVPSESVDALVGAGDALKALGIDASAKTDAAVEGAKDAAAEKVNEAVEGAKEAAAEKVNEAKDAAAEKVNEAKDNAKQKAGDAVDKAAAGVKGKLGL